MACSRIVFQVKTAAKAVFLLQKMNVLGIGETVLDKSITINGFAKEGSKVRACNEHVSVGGPVPIALILLSRLGARCTLVTTLGSDKEGKDVRNTLAGEGIELTVNRSKVTKVNTVLTNTRNGSRTIIKSTAQHKKLMLIPIQLIQEADLIIFDRHEPIAFEYVLKHKKEKTKIITDPSTELSENTLRLITNSTYPIVPIEVYEALAKKISLEKLIVTAGNSGTYLLKNDKLFHEPAYEIKVKDVLGAGDIYRGAFAYAVLKNWGVKRCIKYANLVAALHCTKVGNASAIPTPEEIKEFAKTAKQCSANKISVKQLIGRAHHV